MWQAENIHDLRHALAPWRRQGERVAFVPTMGNLHAGHMALVERARACADRVVVSIFVNPMQFNDADDLARYPRTLQADLDKLQAAGVDGLFLPSGDELYPDGDESITRVEVPGLSDVLEGEHRPGHFAGVTTVVCKLFNCVQPDIAVFGQKDYQQLMLIRRMVRDLNLPVAIESVATQREASGLAMSSRNGLLEEKSLKIATKISEVLEKCSENVVSGLPLEEAESQAWRALEAVGFTPEYCVIRCREDLGKPGQADKKLVILTAAWIGGVRLIDNLELERL